MGQRFLLDSNTIIDYTSELLPATAVSAVDAIINAEFIISIVVKIEVLGFDGEVGKMKKLRRFLEFADVLPLNDEVADKTIELRKRYKKLRLGDAIISATALVYDLALISRNTSDFKKIDKLKLVDPYAL